MDRVINTRQSSAKWRYNARIYRDAAPSGMEEFNSDLKVERDRIAQEAADDLEIDDIIFTPSPRSMHNDDLQPPDTPPPPPPESPPPPVPPPEESVESSAKNSIQDEQASSDQYSLEASNSTSISLGGHEQIVPKQATPSSPGSSNNSASTTPPRADFLSTGMYLYI